MLKRQKGSYTVEAALLMGILLAVLVSVIYIAFWYHDKNFLKGVSYEAVCVAGLQEEAQSAQISAVEYAKKLINGRMLGTRKVETSGQSGKKSNISLHGNFYVPGMIAAFFAGGKLEVQESSTVSAEKPSTKIQKVRGLVKVMRRAGIGS